MGNGQKVKYFTMENRVQFKLCVTIVRVVRVCVDVSGISGHGTSSLPNITSLHKDQPGRLYFRSRY